MRTLTAFLLIALSAALSVATAGDQLCIDIPAELTPGVALQNLASASKQVNANGKTHLIILLSEEVLRASLVELANAKAALAQYELYGGNKP